MKGKLITPHEASNLISNWPLVRTIETCPLLQAVNATSAEDWICDRPQPPFNRVMMDGVAIRYNDYILGKRAFEIQGVQAAGDPFRTYDKAVEAIEIMTGAVMPDEFDVVVPYEQLAINQNTAQIQSDSIKKGQHIHWLGSDFKQGEIIPMKNKRIGIPEVGIAASIGLTEVAVVKRPRVLIVATGDELVPIQDLPEPHQIRMSNFYALSAAVKSSIGVDADVVHLLDQQHGIQAMLADATQAYDMILLSGAVSRGKFDFVPEAVAQIGADTVFHGIAQKPGKPMLFAVKDGCRIFALPGNPVSALVCWARYVRPFLTGESGFKWPSSGVLESHQSLTRFIPVQSGSGQVGKAYQPLVTNGSGDFMALRQAIGFIEVAPHGSTSEQGELIWLI